jgi:hypothetical protein
MDWRQALLRWRVQWKRGTTATWTSANTVLLLAEPGWDEDLRRMKVGDGETPWNDLPWASLDAADLAEIEILLASVTDLDDGRMTVIDTDPGSDFRVQQDLRLGNAFVGRVGLFDDFSGAAPEVPSSIVFVRTDGYALGGIGAANYAYDAAVNGAYVTANPRSSFLAADGRGFKLIPSRVNAFMFGAVGDLATVDTAALQAFATFVSTYDVGIADVGGQFLVDQPIHLTHATQIQTRQFSGYLFLQAQAASTGTHLLWLTNAHYTIWDSVEGLGTGTTGSYTSRGWQTAVYLETTSGISFRRLRGTHLAFAVGAMNNTCSKVSWGNVKGSDVGSGARNGTSPYGLTTMVSNITRTGSATSVTQTSTIDVTTPPPTFITDGLLYGALDSSPVMIVLTLLSGATREFYIKAVDIPNSRLTVYPWVGTDTDTAVAADYLYGGAIYTHGSDGNLHHFDQIDAIRCASAITASGLYGPVGSRPTTQNCGAGIILGGAPGGAHRGTKLSGFYPENNRMDVLLVPRPGSNVTWEISSDYALDPAKMRVVGNNRAADGTESTNYQSLVGGRFSYGGRIYSGIKASRGAAYGSSAQTFDITRTDQVDVFAGNTLTANYTLNPDIHRLTGYDSAQLVVVGTGSNSAPTGTVTFPAPAGYTINGGAGPVTFANLGGPGRFLIRFDLVAGNVVVTQVTTSAPPPMAFSKSGVLTVAAGAHRIYAERDFTILSVRASVGTAPTTTAVIVDINKDGTSIFGASSRRPTIAVAGNTSGAVAPVLTGGTPDTALVPAGSYITVDVDQVDVVAADLTVQIRAV